MGAILAPEFSLCILVVLFLFVNDVYRVLLSELSSLLIIWLTFESLHLMIIIKKAGPKHECKHWFAL